MDLFELIPNTWQAELEAMRPLLKSIGQKLDLSHVNPQYEEIFKALTLPPEKVKVVILGQDPYPNKNMRWD